MTVSPSAPSEWVTWLTAAGPIVAAAVALYLGHKAGVRETEARERMEAGARQRAQRMSAGFHHEFTAILIGLDRVGERLFKAANGQGGTLEAFQCLRDFSPVFELPLLERFIDQLDGFDAEQATKLTLLYSELKHTKSMLLDDARTQMVCAESASKATCALYADQIGELCEMTVNAGKSVVNFANEHYEFPQVPSWVEKARMQFRVTSLRKLGR